jgi:hypothetical protein
MMGLEPEMPAGTKPIATSPSIGGAETDTNQRQQSQDANKPKNTIDNQLKIAKSADELEVSWVDFVRIVESKVGFSEFDKANVLYLETTDNFILYFSDGMWKYKTHVKKKEIDVEKFKFERLRNAVKLLA